MKNLKMVSMIMIWSTCCRDGNILVDPYYIFMYIHHGEEQCQWDNRFKAAAKVAGVSAAAISLDKLFDNLATTGEVNPKV